MCPSDLDREGIRIIVVPRRFARKLWSFWKNILSSPAAFPYRSPSFEDRPCYIVRNCFSTLKSRKKDYLERRDVEDGGRF